MKISALPLRRLPSLFAISLAVVAFGCSKSKTDSETHVPPVSAGQPGEATAPVVVAPKAAHPGPAVAAPGAGHAGDPHATVPKGPAATAPVAPMAKAPAAKGSTSVSVETAFTDRAKLEGKLVTVRGKVVKFTANTMNTNWLHIQDGTGGDGTNNLTVTSDDVAALGDTVTITGKVSLNKDFGAGYKYDLIVEGASVTKN